MMTDDPLGLFRDGPPQLTAPPKASAGGGASNWLILLVLLLASGFFLWDRFAPDGDRHQDQQQQNQTISQQVKSIILIEETGDRVKFPHIASLLNDSQFWDGLQAKGVPMRPYESDSADAAPYLAAAEAVGLPALLLVGENKQVLLAKPVPPTRDGVTQMLQSLR